MARTLDLASVRAVLATELRGIVRDRRALFAAVVLPILLYPALLAGMHKLETSTDQRQKEEQHTVAVALDALEPAVRARVEAALAAPDLHLDVQPAAPAALAAAAGEAPDAEAVLGEGVDALLVARAPDDAHPEPRLTVYLDSGRDASTETAGRLSDAAGELARAITHERVLSVLPSDPAEAVAVESRDLAPPEDAAGHALGRILPLIAVLVLVSGASFAALSAFAGEREAGTLETLLVQPVAGRTVALGKLLAITVTGLVALFGNAASFFASSALGLGDLPGFQTAGAMEVGALRTVLGVLLILPTAVLLCAATALISARAKSFREGQHLVLPLTLGAAALSGLAAVDRVSLNPLLALVPVTGGALAFRDALSGSLAPLSGAIAFVASAGWAALLAGRVGRALDAERLLRERDTASELAARRVQSRRALAWGFAGAIVLYVVGGWLQTWDLTRGLALTMWVVLPTLALLAVRGTARRAGERIDRALWLRLPHPAHALGALLVVPGLAHAILHLADLQGRLLPLPGAGKELVPLLDLPLWIKVGLLAVSPGVCEELFFRGAILSGLRRDLPARKIVLWQGLLFGIAHASVFRFVPTALVGAGLAGVTLRARSLLPAMLLHATYDGLLVTAVLEHPPAWLGEGPSYGLAAVGLLLLVLVRAHRRADAP